MEYWAVIWGTIIMGVTGLIVWFKMDVTQWLPRWAVDVSLTIHYYEALLACLAILVWHFYHVIFDPDVYPVNAAFLDGRIAEQREEEGSGLKTEMLMAVETDGNGNGEPVVASGDKDGAVRPRRR